MFRKILCFFVFSSLFLWVYASISLANNDVPMKYFISMAEKIAKAKAFSVTMQMGYDVIQENGQKIEFGEYRYVKINRPNKIRVDALKSNGEKVGLVFDGKILLQYNLKQGVYGELKKPGTVDEMIHYAVSTLKIRLPLARMLVTTFPREIKKLCKEFYFVEHDVLWSEPTDHYAGRTDEVDFQVWIAKDNLPRRIIITYKTEDGQPQFWANFYDWNLKPKFDNNTFVFSPDKKLEKIPILIPVTKREKDMKNTGGKK